MITQSRHLVVSFDRLLCAYRVTTVKPLFLYLQYIPSYEVLYTFDLSRKKMYEAEGVGTCVQESRLWIKLEEAFRALKITGTNKNQSTAVQNCKNNQKLG